MSAEKVAVGSERFPLASVSISACRKYSSFYWLLIWRMLDAVLLLLESCVYARSLARIWALRERYRKKV